ncbi:MAG: hypothetical protein OEV30_10545 [Ignavibacteria bacterium]|nr:hypothetical protein [Ignavibacteria bacterium]
MSRNAVLVLSVLTFIAMIIAGAVSQMELFPEEEEGGVQLPPYEAVREVFERGDLAEDCETVTEALKALQPYLVNQEYVPAQFAETVTLPRRKTRPTISDLAIDRTMRLETRREQLCSGQ